MAAINWAGFRRYLVAGLLVWVPLGITLLIIGFLIDLMDRSLLVLPASWHPDALLGFHIPGLGALLSLAVVMGTGVAVTNLLGRHTIAFGERFLARIPVVRTIYSAAKQLTETIFNGTGKSFRRVVMVEYPREGCWTLGFVTADGMEEASRKAGRTLVNVFVPTTPNPTSGFFLMFPRDHVIELDISVDAGIKLIISAGAVVPPQTKDTACSPSVSAIDETRAAS